MNLIRRNSDQRPSTPTQPRLPQIFAGLLAVSVLLSACSAEWVGSLPGAPTRPAVVESPAVPPPTETVLEQSELTFQVQLPSDTPSDAEVYLSVVDEVTGLALNADLYPMAYDEQASGLDRIVYSLTLPFVPGSVVKYRYERQAEAVRVLEHVADGSPVRYRLAYASHDTALQDVVSRWTDTVFDQPTGRIMGVAQDANDGAPIPNLLVAAGGAQSFTAADGSFVIEGLPEGVHNLVGLSPDGSYQTFQQGATIAAGSTTPAPLQLQKAEMVNVTFQVTVPEGTPPLVPLRMAGSLIQLGNTFTDLGGGINVLATRMPVLQTQPDGKYSLSLSLPVGADIRYKYTFGDGFWNAEHTSDGDFAVRQLIVKPGGAIVEDAIASWFSGDPTYLSFDITVPANTPPGETVSIQFSPLFGWMPSFPMWSLGDNRYVYVLLSPLTLPGGVSYRYCRNDQCGLADDLATPGFSASGRPIDLDTLPKAITEEVTAWTGLEIDPASFPVPEVEVFARPAGFIAGVEFVPLYQPSWKAHLPQAMSAVSSLNPNWLVLSPTWTAVGNQPVSLQVRPDQDATWPELLDMASQAQALGMQVAYRPSLHYPDGMQTWWADANRDFSWWVTWFDRYQTYLLHHARLAAQTNAAALIIDGESIAPALPGGLLLDGSESGVPADADERWLAMIAKVREVYPGPVYWGQPFGPVQALNFSPPPFLDAVDGIYLLWSAPLAATPESTLEEQAAEAARLLDFVAAPVLVGAAQTETETLPEATPTPVPAPLKPIILAASIPSPDLQVQYDQYALLLEAISSRGWITGFVSRGYFPPVILQYEGPSVHGKPAEAALRHWYSGWLADNLP